MDSDRQRWEGRYSEAACLHGNNPSRFLLESLPDILSLPTGKQALDIACGEGRNSLFLARNGFTVTGVDIADTALRRARQRIAEAGLIAEFLAVDLKSWRPTQRYDVILNINYLQRELLPILMDHLNPGGLLLLDTIMVGETVIPASNPAHLLAPGELAAFFGSLPGRIITCTEYPTASIPHAAMLFQAPIA